MTDLMRPSALSFCRLFPLIGLAACSAAQDPFLGTYDVLAATDSTFANESPMKTSRRTSVVVSAGSGNQLIFSIGPLDAGNCLLTGTAESSTAFNMDVNGQGCVTLGADGGIVYSEIKQGSGSVDAVGNLALNQSGTLTLKIGLVTVKGTFQQAVAGSRDGG
jgi:hypothetical protein